MSVAIYPGSFDPVTLGHLNIIKRASACFDKLIVCVMVNSNKHGMFTPDERVDLLRRSTKRFPNVEVDFSNELLAAYRAGGNLDTLVEGHDKATYSSGTNGTYLDGVRVSRAVLRNGAVINVPAQVFAFTGGMLHYHAHQSGISIQLVNVYKTVKNANTGKPLNIVDGTSFQVEPNSFVVLVGGSGTGKSSLLTCITGTAPCTAGSVRFDGLDTGSNRNAFEAALGYVPQKDIMHDSLTVEQSLTYTAKLRIAHDATRTEIAAAVAHAIEAVDLQGREKTYISKLSGGQKKRVSIAMELLANPRLLILDEPTSGLSPDLDRSMMELCRRLSHQNCTVLMVTHNMSNINLCDKIAFLGVGGVLCYYGAPEQLNDYFDVEMTSDIFEKLRDAEQVELYRRKYFTTPEFNRLLVACPEAAQEADKRCSQ